MSAKHRYPRRGLHGELVHRIGLQILSGELQANDLVPVESGAVAELGASRSVFREAVKVLQAKGLIEAKQSLGTRVQPRSQWNLLDPDVLAWFGEIDDPDSSLLRSLTEVRILIEPPSARIAAARGTQEEIERVRELFAVMEALADSPAEFAPADVRFHAAIVAATHNELLEQLTRSMSAALVRTRTWLSEAWVGMDGSGIRGTLPGHAKIVSALERRDGAGAERASRALLEGALEDLEAVMAARQRTSRKGGRARARPRKTT
jgi:DNA-binding FadR family transcriptional regulator